jgi:hypothetical protein
VVKRARYRVVKTFDNVEAWRSQLLTRERAEQMLVEEETWWDAQPESVRERRARWTFEVVEVKP